MNIKDFRQQIRYAALFGLGLFLLFTTDYCGFFQGTDQYLYDFSFRLRGAKQINPSIVLVTIDEKTLTELGRWPINRSYYTRAIRAMDQAAVIGMDIILTEPSLEDQDLNLAMENYGRIVLPVYIDQHFKLSRPNPVFSGIRSGHIHFDIDADGILRKMFHRLTCNNTYLESFAYAIYSTVKPYNPRPLDLGSNAKQQDIPVIYQEDPYYINFSGPSGTVPMISFSDVIEGRWPPAFFKDKIVLTGVTCAGIEERIYTPFSQDGQRMHGIEVHAHILDTLLADKPIKQTHQWVRWIVASLLSMVFFFIAIRLQGLGMTLFWAAAMILTLACALALFFTTTLWAAPALILSTLTLAAVLSYIYRLETLGIRLQRANQDWEDSFHSINDAMTIHDPDGTIARANRAARDTFGKPLLDLLEKRSSPPFPDQFPPVEEIHDPLMDRHLEIKRFARLTSDSRNNGLVHIVRDISERVKSRERQELLQRQVFQSQKMEAIGTMTGGIAHDFSNLLSTIMGYMELVAMSASGSDDTRHQIQEIRRAGQRARELVNQILSFSSQASPEKTPISITETLDEILTLLRSTLPPSIVLQTDIRTRRRLNCETAQIHQVIINLCTNAIQAMKTTGGTLRITLDEAQPPGPASPGRETRSHILVSVGDQGQGMPEEILSRIFDPYFTTRPKEGTGLGLAVVKGIVDYLGGRIIVESTPGKGSRFDVYLPVADPESRDKEPARAPVTPGGNERILLIDDEQALAVLGQETLSILGYQVTAATNPIEALELFRTDPGAVDLVITDMIMPQISGDILAAELMKLRRDIPVILYSGFTDEITEERVKAAGIRAFLMKPIPMVELAKTVRKVLDSR
ncbi:MAG: CHASE2 domain-containing protein [Pseudomonadota bacterium]